MGHHRAFQYEIAYLLHIFLDCNAFFLKVTGPRSGSSNVVLTNFVAFILGLESFSLNQVHATAPIFTPMEFLNLKSTSMTPSFARQYLWCHPLNYQVCRNQCHQNRAHSFLY